MISLIWQLGHSAFAQTKPQILLAPAPKRIVLLYSYGDGIPAYQQVNRGFLPVMKEGGVSVNNLFFEYLDLERKKDNEHKRNLVSLFRHKYEGTKIDLVVTAHTQALKFILSEGKNLFSTAPVVSFLAPDVIETPGIERRVLLLPMKMDFKGTLELALKLFPQTQRVVFINGVGEGERRLEGEAKSFFVQWRDRLEFEYTDNLSVEEMLERIANLPSRTIVFYSNVFRDKTGRTFIPRDVAAMVARAANAPVFGMYNTVLGSGIIGGSVFNFEAEGARAAATALDLLRGKISLTKPVTILTASRIPMFDWQQLKRWGLDESALPPDSIVLNRPVSGWKEHKLEIIGILLFCLLETALIIFLIVQKRRRDVAEKTLKLKTEELDQFFNISLDLLCVANTDGYFLRLNPAWEKVLGYTSQELTAKRFLEFVHPDDLDSTREAIATLASQQQVTFFENRYRCKDGTYRWLQWSSAPAGKLIYGAARDITENKRIEEALRESENRFREVAESVSDFIWEVDANGLYRYTSPSVERILGYRPDELVGKKHFYDLFAPDVREELKTAAFKVFAAKEAFRVFPNPNISKEGRVVHLETSGVPVLDSDGNLAGYRGADTDVTERKQAEAKIRKAAEEWQTTFDSISDMVMLLDQEHKIVQINEAALSFFKLPLDRVLGNHCYTLMHGTSKPVEICPLAKMMKTKRHEETEHYDDKMGAWFHVSVDPILDDRGEITRAVHTVKDITQRKLAEEASRKSERILRQSENDLLRLTGRLIYAQEEERRRLARELHDDLAQRLAVFAIDVGKIEQQLTDSPAPVQEKLRGMKEDVVKISRDVHNLSRQLHPSILDDLGLIKAVESECRNFSQREGIDIAFSHENISTVIPRDVSLSLYRIIQEGLRNISKHACADHISVSLRGIDHDVFLSVQDDGIGFDSAEVREKPGLGLSSIRERVRLIHGELSIQSQPEKGTLITVRVPLMKEGE